MRIEHYTYRHQLIEHYLDAETSSEEEEVLANFYRQADVSELTEEDLDIRNLILGIESYDHLLKAENSQKEENSQKAENSRKEENSQKAENSRKEENSRKAETKWVRLSALLLVAAMLTGLIFMVFPVKEMFTPKHNFANLVPTTQIVRSQPISDDENAPQNDFEQMKREDSLFLVATKDIVNPKEVSSGKINKKMIAAKWDNNGKTAQIAKETTEKSEKNTKETAEKLKKETKEMANKSKKETQETTEANNLEHIGEVASLALPSANQLTIDRQGDNIIISTVDEDGNPRHYTIDISEAQNGTYQIHPLAQLNDYQNGCLQ